MKKPVAFSSEGCRLDGTSDGGATAVWAAAVDSRVKWAVARSGEPQKLVVVRGDGRDEVDADPASSTARPAALAWHPESLPAR